VARHQWLRSVIAEPRLVGCQNCWWGIINKSGPVPSGGMRLGRRERDGKGGSSSALGQLEGTRGGVRAPLQLLLAPHRVFLGATEIYRACPRNGGPQNGGRRWRRWQIPSPRSFSTRRCRLVVHGHKHGLVQAYRRWMRDASTRRVDSRSSMRWLDRRAPSARSTSLSAAAIFVAATPGSPASFGRPRSMAWVTAAAAVADSAARCRICAALSRSRTAALTMRINLA
jgi:hypothetical protein